MYGTMRSWRAVMAKSALTVLVVLTIASFVYPDSRLWIAIYGVALTGTLTALLALGWHRFERRLRSAGYDW
jgi:hypothetical protein